MPLFVYDEDEDFISVFINMFFKKNFFTYESNKSIF